MNAILCKQKNDCECIDSVVENLTSEGGDADRFLSQEYFIGDNPLNRRFGQLGCLSWCFSEISQDDADDCAQRQAQECVYGSDEPQQPDQDPPPTEPPYEPLVVYHNTRQSCTFTCQSGLSHTYVVEAGTVPGLTQVEADAIAYSYACYRAKRDAGCIPPSVVPTIYYSALYTIDCPPGTQGETVVVPEGMFSSTISQQDADSFAEEYGNDLSLAECRYYNTEQTAECPGGTSGQDVITPADTYSSLVSQADADQQALDAALAALDCTEDFDCLGTPNSFQTAIWTQNTVDFPAPPCGVGSITSGSGTWSVLRNRDGSCDDATLVMDTTICTQGDGYETTWTIPWSFSGTFNNASTNQINFVLQINNVIVAAQTVDLELGLNPTIVFSGPLPHGIVPIRLSFDLECLPTTASDSVECHGTIVITPTTPP